MTLDGRRWRIGAAALAVVAAAVGAAVVLTDDDDGTVEPAEDIPFEVGPGEAAAYGREFVPAEVEVAPGERVSLRNEDDEPHTFTADDGLFDSGVLEPGEAFEATFEGPQRIAFHCDIHPSMTGFLVIEG